ncbi:MAG: hypothetical protein V1885_00590 [Candidatus Brennerbacteria bacterium]
MRSQSKRDLAGRGAVPNGRQGYIAIVASIVVTTIVGVVALVFSSSNFLGRYDTLALEEKGASRALAEGCLEYARLALAVNPSYAGGNTVPIASSTCRVVSVVTVGQEKRITTSATIGTKTTNLITTVRASDLAITGRGEEILL